MEEEAKPTKRDILTYGRLLVLNEGAILHQGPLFCSTGPVWGLLTSCALILFAPIGSAKVQSQIREPNSPPSSKGTSQRVVESSFLHKAQASASSFEDPVDAAQYSN